MNLPATQTLAWDKFGRAFTQDGFRCRVFRGLLTQKVRGYIQPPGNELPVTLFGDDEDDMRQACAKEVERLRAAVADLGFQ